MITMLQHIVDRGAPAQASRARALLDELAANADSPQARRDAAALIEAFLHDPVLTR